MTEKKNNNQKEKINNKKKMNKIKNTINVQKISTNCFLFLQNAYQCSCNPRTYVVEVVLEHLYMSRLKMTKTNKMTVRPASAQSDQNLRCAFNR